MKECDMKDTALCEWYQKRYACMYGHSHGVECCPYGQLDYYILKANDKEEIEK